MTSLFYSFFGHPVSVISAIILQFMYAYYLEKMSEEERTLFGRTRHTVCCVILYLYIFVYWYQVFHLLTMAAVESKQRRTGISYLKEYQ